MALKIMVCCFSILILLILIFLIIFFTASSGTIEKYKDSEGHILENSIAEKTVVNLNGADNGLIIRGKNLENPVLLFVSSGPGTSDYFYNEIYPDMNLEDFYTVCYWDYRGMCLVYDKNIDPSTITAKQLQEDTFSVTQYLKNRFGKEKIYIMGFSGGTHIALEAAKLHPENYYAYIGMAQAVSNDADNDTLIYNFMKKVFSERGEKSNLKKLEKSVQSVENGKVLCKDRAAYIFLLHKAGGGTIKDKSEFAEIIIPILKSRCYTVKEKFDYIRGMKMYRSTPFYSDVMKRDYRQSVTALEIPAYFISGDTDFNSPWPLVEQYFRQIEAPEKKFLLVENAAHSPLWENPVVVVNFLKDIGAN